MKRKPRPGLSTSGVRAIVAINVLIINSVAFVACAEPAKELPPVVSSKSLDRAQLSDSKTDAGATLQPGKLNSTQLTKSSAQGAAAATPPQQVIANQTSSAEKESRLSSSQDKINWDAISAIGSVAGAVATFLAVIAALFGGAIQARLYPPQLRLWLENPSGVDVQSNIQSGIGKGITALTRWFHIRLENQRRWAVANDPQVLLLMVEEVLTGGGTQIIWQGETPLSKQSEERRNYWTRLGSAINFDVMFALANDRFQIQTKSPTTDMPLVQHAPIELILTFRGISIEAESSVLRLNVKWASGTPFPTLAELK